MNHSEIISQLVEKNQKILYIGNPAEVIKQNSTPSIFYVIDPLTTPEVDLSALDKDFDTVVFDEILEKIDNPRQQIEKFKWHAKNALIYEFKYDQLEEIPADWKLSWKDVGLENILTWEFDYVRSLYLGYATAYFCEGPNKYTPEQLAAGLPVNHP